MKILSFATPPRACWSKIAEGVASGIPKKLKRRPLCPSLGAGLLGLLLWLLGASHAQAAPPQPIARWTFEGDARDSVGGMHGELLGDASLANGRLVVGGNGHARMAPLAKDLAAKTLVARVKVDPLSQRGGGALSVQSTGGLVFDALVYGERMPGQWIAGSDEFRRTQDLAGAFPEEASAGFVEMATTYGADGTISVFRNGLPYGQPYRLAAGPQTFFGGSSEVLLGMRHGPIDRVGGNYFLRGEIEEAALYDRALTAEEIAELAGVAPAPETNLLANGGFEAGSLAEWTVAGQAQPGTNQPVAIPLIVSNYAAQGAHAFSPYRSPNGVRLSQIAPTEPGKNYVLSFAHALIWETTGSFAVLIHGVEQEAVVLDPSLPLGHRSQDRATWAYATRTFTATAAATEVAFHFPPDLGGYALLDDVKVYPATESPPAMTMEWASDSVEVDEGAEAAIRVRRAGRLDQRAFATVELRRGTATLPGNAGADVSLGHATGHNRLGLTFQPGQAEVAVVVQGRADTLPEPPETATLHLLATGNAAVNANPATVTVITPPTRIVASGWAEESSGAGRIELAAQSGPGGRVRVQTTDAGTAKRGEDFLPLDQEVTVTSLGSIAAPLVVVRDNRIEGEETIGIRITPLNDGVEVATPEFLIPLMDAPGRVYPVVDSSQLLESGRVAESTRVLRFILRREGQADSPDVFQARYLVEGREDPDLGIAAARVGVDYLAAEGMAEFGPGVAEVTVEVALLNDSEPDGPRGLTLQLKGSPQFPDLPNLASATGWAILEDDERAALVQQADLSPFMLGEKAWLSRGPGGRTRLVQTTRVLELLPSGLPDLNFGGGVGRLSEPTGGLTDWGQQRFHEPRTLADGRHVFLLPDRIVRWTARGEPDPTFGDGSGSVPLPEPFVRLVHLAEDGTLTLVTGEEGEARRLRRLLPNGRPDPGFVASEFQAPDQFAVERAASGHHWVLAPPPSDLSALELRRLLPDGRPDPVFTPRAGVTHSFGLDAHDRAYFAVAKPVWNPTDGAEAAVALVRFLPDGRLDEDYRPARPEVTWVQGEVAADGSLLGSTGGLEFLELNPAGEVVWQWEYPHPWALNPSATREPDGRVQVAADVEHWDCISWGPWGPPSCWSYWLAIPYRISKDGGSEPVYASSRWLKAEDLMDAVGTRWVRTWSRGASVEPTAYERSLPVAIGSKAGVGRLTQVALRGQSIRVPIQRAGSTLGAATLRGRVFPWLNGRWEAESAVPFEVTLPSGAAETDLELGLPTPSDGIPLVEWLVRLESASGTELSPLGESRLWIFANAPKAGELSLVPSAGPDTPRVVWLARSEGVLQTTDNLGNPVWDWILEDYPGTFQLGSSATVVGWDTGPDQGPRFFRVGR